MLTSKPPLPEKSLMLMLPGKPNTTPKRDSHSIPQERPGLLTCQTMLLRMEISTSRPQPQLRRLWPMPPRLKPRPKLMLPHQRRRPPPLPQLKLPHHSFNSTEEETLLKRDQATNPNLNHPDPSHQELPPPTPLIHQPIEIKMKRRSPFSDREFVFKEFK